MFHYLEKYLLEQRDRLPEKYRDAFMIHVKNAWAYNDMVYGSTRIAAEDKLERLAFFPTEEIVKWFECTGSLEWTKDIENRKKAILGGYLAEYEANKDKFARLAAVSGDQVNFYLDMGFQKVCTFDTPIRKNMVLMGVPEENEYTSLFKQFINDIEFELVKCPDGWVKLHDTTGANWAGVESEKFRTGSEIIERLSAYIYDYYVADMIERLKINSDASWETVLDAYVKEFGPSQSTAFLDMILYHSDEVKI